MSAGLSAVIDRRYSFEHLASHAPKFRDRSRPWIERAHAVMNLNRGHRPIDESMLFFEDRREGRERIVLRLRLECAVHNSTGGFQQNARAQFRKAIVQLRGSFIRADMC